MLTMLRLAVERDVLKVKDDEFISPTYAADLAEGIVGVIEGRHYGLYHLTNSGSCSWYEFAKEIFSLAGVEVEVLPVPGSEYSLPRRGPPTASSPPWGARNCATGARPWRTIYDARCYLGRRVLRGAATFPGAVAQRVEARVELRDESRGRRIVQVVQFVRVFPEVVQLVLFGLVLDVEVSLRPYGPVRRHWRYGPIRSLILLVAPVADLESRAPGGRIVTLRPVEQGRQRAAIYGGRRPQARQVCEGRGEVVVQDHLVPTDPAGTPGPRIIKGTLMSSS